jgi:hypothetical protein
LISRAHLSQLPGFHGWDSQYWGHGFFGLENGAWVWFEAPWWISPDYPGWVWIGPQSAWDDDQDDVDGQQGYWSPAE